MTNEIFLIDLHVVSHKYTPMRLVFFSIFLTIFAIGCSPGSQHQTKVFIDDPKPILDKIDLNSISIECPTNDCPESLALFVSVYKFKTTNPNLTPNTYHASKTCNSSVVKNPKTLKYELYTSGHCSHKEDDIRKFKQQYPQLRSYTFQSRSHYLYVYNSHLDTTLKLQLAEPDWNFYQPDKLFSLDIMRFTLHQNLFSDLELTKQLPLPKTAQLFTLRKKAGSLFTIKKQECDIEQQSSEYTYELSKCLIMGGDSGAPVISNGQIYGFISHTNNFTLGGQFVPSSCIEENHCPLP